MEKTDFIFGCLLLVSTIYAAPVNDNEVDGAPLNIDIPSIDFLTRFGYYSAPDPRLGTLVSEEGLRGAISRLQRFGNIPETGVIDAKTKELLETPRCGMPDFGPSDNARRKRRFTLQGTTWKKSDLTWRLTNLNNDGLSRAKVEATLELAFGKWQAVTNLNFKKVDTEYADILVSFEENYHNDPYPFDGRGGTLAHAFYPHTNQGLSGDVHFDDAEQFTLGTPEGRNLLWVAVHEIGHSIGLEHSNVKEAIMYPWYKGYQGVDFDLKYDDIIGIQNIYGSRQNPKTNPPTEAPQPGKPTVAHTQMPGGSCPSSYQSIFYDKDSTKTYVINDYQVYILGTNLGVERGPLELRTVFPGIDRADAVYVRGDGRIVFFKDTSYYIFESVRDPRIVSSGSIFSKYRGLRSDVKKIDAAFVWLRNGRTYLFVGEDYYRYDENRQAIDYGYPKRISDAWKDVPNHVDSVFIWRNDVTYFFKGDNYYRLDDNKITVEGGYPKKIAPIWSKCAVGTVEESRSDATSVPVSFPMLLTVLTVTIAKVIV